MKTWEEVRCELYTPEEIAESNMRVALMAELIRARKEQGISQRKLEELSGIKQLMIARIENGNSNPRLETVIKLHTPLGMILEIVPMKKV